MSAPKLVISCWLLVIGSKKQRNLLCQNPKPKTQNQLGFTLVELLIAISIVAIISTIGLISYSKAQTLGRDAKRKQDLRSISVALQLFYQTNKRYPNNSNDWVSSTNTTATPWISELNSTYINSLPIDPTSNGGSPWVDDSYGYAYLAYSTPCGLYQPNTFYVLVAQLENKNDPDRNAEKNYKWCDGLTLVGRWSPYSFVITP